MDCHPLDLAVLYTTHPVISSFPQSVPRLLSALVRAISSANPGWSLHVIALPGSDVAGAHAVALPGAKILGRFYPVLAKCLRRAGLAWLTPRLAVGSILLLRRAAKVPDVVVCVRGDDLKMAARIWPQTLRIWMPVSLPLRFSPRGLYERLAVADLVVVHSAPTYEWIYQQVENLCFRPPVIVITGPIDIERIQKVCATHSRHQVRQGFAVDDDEVLIIQVGARPEKGAQIVELAIAMCPSFEERVHLVSIGHANESLRVCSNGAKLHRIRGVDLETFYKWLVAADIGTVPSVYLDSGPTALLEMLAAKLPVIAGNSGGPKFFLRDGAGFLVEHPNAVAEWAFALYELTRHEDRRIELGNAALKRFHELGCTEGQVARKWTDAIKKLLEASFRCNGQPNKLTGT